MIWIVMVITFAIFGPIGVLVNRNNLKSAYEEALKGMDKEKALKAARAYYKALRSNKTLTIYDEQAISNDISTMKTETTNFIGKQGSVSVLDRLEKLGRLKAQGLLTEEEFNKQKQKILNE